MEQDSKSRPGGPDSDRPSALTTKSHAALEAERILNALRENEALSTSAPTTVPDERKVVLPPGVPEASVRREVIVLDPTSKGPWILDGESVQAYAPKANPENPPENPGGNKATQS
jgi:hypothetical protein